MGEEILYTSDFEDTCPICGNKLHVEIDVWEYPIGAIEYSEERCTGASIIEQPQYNPFLFDDF